MAKDTYTGELTGGGVPPKKPRQFVIHFQQDRSKELYVNGRYIKLGPFGTAQISEDELKSPDFQSQAHFFAVTEVS